MAKDENMQAEEEQKFPKSSDKTYSLVEIVKAPLTMVDKGPDDTVFSFPIVAIWELILGLGVVLVLVLFSLLKSAPLEEMANPLITTDPAKAPWYFMGLQEMLEHMHPTLAGSKDTSGVDIGMAGDMTVAVGADGQLVNQARNREPGDAPSTHLLKIDVRPFITFGADGNVPHIRWIANVTVFELTKARVVISESSADEAGIVAAQGGRPYIEYMNDPEYRENSLEFHHDNPKDAVKAALENISSNGRINLPPAPTVTPKPKPSPTKVALAGGAVLLALLAGWALLSGGDDSVDVVVGDDSQVAIGTDPDPEPTAVVEPTEVPTVEPTIVPSPTATAIPWVPPEHYAPAVSVLRGALVEDGLTRLLVEEGFEDGMGDWIYSSSDYTAGNPGGDVDLWDVGAGQFSVTRSWADTVFNQSVFECGETTSLGTTVCGSGDDVTEGEMIVALQVLSDPVAGEDWTYQYAAVFDADNSPDNNWQPQGMFDWDYFQGTDTWFIADYAQGQWSGSVYAGSFGNPVASAFRAVILENVIVWFVPISEVPQAQGVQVTSFRHDGSFAPEVSAGDVAGANPTEPLIPFIELAAPGAVDGPAEPDEPPVDTETTSSTEDAIRSFVAEFDAAHQAGNLAFLIEHLDPLVIERYGADQCDSYVAATMGSIQNLEIIQIMGPQEISYDSDDLSTAIPDGGFRLELDLDANGTRTTANPSYRIVDGIIRWFTDCGEIPS